MGWGGGGGQGEEGRGRRAGGGGPTEASGKAETQIVVSKLFEVWDLKDLRQKQLPRLKHKPTTQIYTIPTIPTEI
jgi:hypothetical protein